MSSNDRDTINPLDDALRLRPGALRRYGVALLAAALPLALTLPLGRASAGEGVLLSTIAVALSAGLGGFGPGLLTTSLSALVALYFLSPAEGFAGGGWGRGLSLNMFVLEGVAISALGGALRYVRRRSEARAGELRESRGLFRLLSESTVKGVAIHEDGRILEANPMLARMFGFGPEELVGKSAFELVAPESRESVLRHMTGGGEQVYEAVGVRKDGSRFPVRVQGKIVRYGGRDVRMKFFRDLTEFRVAEEALRASEERSRSVLENVPDYVLLLDRSGEVAYINHPVPGFSREQVVGQNAFSFLHPDSRRVAAEALELVFATGESCECEIIDQFSRVYHDRFVPLAHEGRVNSVLAVATDVTERKRAEAELRAKESELQEIINRTPFMLTRCSRDLRYRFISRAYAEAIGRTPEQVAGRPLIEIMGEEGLRTISPYIERVLAGQRVEYETEVSFSGVGAPYLHVVYTPDWDEHGEVVGWFASIVDITERRRAEEALRESEERFRRLVEGGNVIAWEADAETNRFTYVSPQAKAILGYEAADWYAEDFWPRRLHPDDRDFALRYCDEMSRRADDYEFEYRMIAADGRAVWLRDIVSVVRPGAGPRRLRGFMLDITRSKQLELSLRRLAERLTHAQEDERRRIARELHDDIGQTLSATAVRLRVLEDDFARGGANACAEVAQALSTLDRAQRGLRRIARAMHPSVLEHFGLAEALRAFAAEAATPETRVTLNAPTTFPRLSPAVESAAYRIAQEAVGNALKHARARRVRIRLRADGGELSLEVADDGCGFDPGARGGVGLFSMGERAEMIMAKLEVVSRPGGGTRVRLRAQAGEPAQSGETLILALPGDDKDAPGRPPTRHTGIDI